MSRYNADHYIDPYYYVSPMFATPKEVPKMTKRLFIEEEPSPGCVKRCEVKHTQDGKKSMAEFGWVDESAVKAPILKDLEDNLRKRFAVYDALALVGVHADPAIIRQVLNGAGLAGDPRIFNGMSVVAVRNTILAWAKAQGIAFV